MNSVNARLMFARLQRRGFENEAMPIIIRTPCRMHVGAKLSGRSVIDKLVIYEELNFHARAKIRFVDGPTRNCLSVGLVEPASQIRIRRNEIKCHRDARNQERLDNRLSDQKMD